MYCAVFLLVLILKVEKNHIANTWQNESMIFFKTDSIKASKL